MVNSLAAMRTKARDEGERGRRTSQRAPAAAYFARGSREISRATCVSWPSSSTSSSPLRAMAPMCAFVRCSIAARRGAQMLSDVLDFVLQSSTWSWRSRSERFFSADAAVPKDKETRPILRPAARVEAGERCRCRHERCGASTDVADE